MHVQEIVVGCLMHDGDGGQRDLDIAAYPGAAQGRIPPWAPLPALRSIVVKKIGTLYSSISGRALRFCTDRRPAPRCAPPRCGVVLIIHALRTFLSYSSVAGRGRQTPLLRLCCRGRQTPASATPCWPGSRPLRQASVRSRSAAAMDRALNSKKDTSLPTSPKSLCQTALHLLPLLCT